MSSLKETLTQIRRTPYQALAAIMVMFLTFFALSLFSLISLGSIKILGYFESAPQVIAFFEKGKDIPQEDITKIKSQLEQTGKLANFKYVSVHEAEAIYKEKNKDDPLLLELVNYKILPPSIEISATEINELPKLKEVLEKQPGVKDIAFYEDIVNSLSMWIKNIRFFGLALVGYLLLQSLLVIVTIIGMKIMAKKSEIEIMRLLGASNWFISWPFILEGIVYGLVSAFFAWGFSYLSLLYATPFLVSWLGEIELLPVSYLVMLGLLLVELIGGVAVGFFGSLISVKRFLKR
jgi:cell division transport system permease protein